MSFHPPQNARQCEAYIQPEGNPTRCKKQGIERYGDYWLCWVHAQAYKANNGPLSWWQYEGVSS